MKTPNLFPTSSSLSGPLQRGGCGLLLSCVLPAWALEFIDLLPGIRLDHLGVRPRELTGLLGIFTMPWLHGGFGHLLSNTPPFVVLGSLVLLIEKKNFVPVSLLLILLSGLGTWLIGRPNSVHIGASALIYGYLGYLLSHSFRVKKPLWFLLGLILAFLYGGMLFQLVPQAGPLSWEGHLAGFLAGLWLSARRIPRVRNTL